MSVIFSSKINYSKQKRIWKVVLADGRVAEVTSHGAFVQNQNGTRSGRQVSDYIYTIDFLVASHCALLQWNMYIFQPGVFRSQYKYTDDTDLWFALRGAGSSYGNSTFFSWGGKDANAKWFEGFLTRFSQKLQKGKLVIILTSYPT